IVGASRRQASKHRSDRLLSPASRAARSALHDPAPTGSTADDHHLPRRPRFSIRAESPSARQLGKLSAEDDGIGHECCSPNTNTTLPSRPVSPCARLTASFQSSSRTVRATRALSVPSPTSVTNSRYVLCTTAVSVLRSQLINQNPVEFRWRPISSSTDTEAPCPDRAAYDTNVPPKRR